MFSHSLPISQSLARNCRTFFIRNTHTHTQYSGTNAEFTKADTVIFRTDLYNMTTGRKEFNFKRTLKYDSKWLDSKYSIAYIFFRLGPCCVALILASVGLYIVSAYSTLFG